MSVGWEHGQNKTDDGKNDGAKRRKDKEHEQQKVACPDALPYPGTVVVIPLDASLAVFTMECTMPTINVADLAPH